VRGGAKAIDADVLRRTRQFQCAPADQSGAK
jgi:hypothetical protein